MTQQPRKRLLVNPTVQLALMKRCLMYWLACVAFLIMPVTLWRTWNLPEQLIFAHLLDVCGEYSGILITAALLLPLAVFDMLRLSNRIAGPLHRLREELSSLADGHPAAPVQFRPDDFWQDVAEQFNRLAERPTTSQGENGAEVQHD